MSNRRFSYRIVESSEAPVLTPDILKRISKRDIGFKKSVFRRFSRWLKPRKHTPADTEIQQRMEAALATEHERTLSQVSLILSTPSLDDRLALIAAWQLPDATLHDRHAEIINLDNLEEI